MRSIRTFLNRLLSRPLRRKPLFVAAGLAMMAVPAVAYAGVIEWILLGLAKIFEWLTMLVGFILFHEVRGLIAVASYSDFVSPGPTAVRVGWVVARDLANMFFILILLVIAFSVILGYEEYNIRRTLPRLLIMAVVINFSKTISGIIIDFGQVVMLTFVNGFKDAAGGNFLRAFQIEKLLELKGEGAISEAGLLLGMMLAFIMVSIATAVVLVMLVTLIFRLVMLWVLIILSPIAFLCSVIPPTQEYYGRWWKEMKMYVTNGPVIAFFLWLALLSAQLSNGNLASGDSEGGNFNITQQGGAAGIETQQQQTATGIPTQASSTDVYISMILFTCLLFAGLKIAQEVGGVGGAKFAGWTQGALKKAGTWAAKRTTGNALRGAGKVTSGAGDLIQRGADKARIGKFVRPFSGALKTAGGAVGAQGGRLAPPGGIDRLRQAVLGSPEELRKVSPAAFAQGAGSAKGARAKEFASEAQKSKGAIQALSQSDNGLKLYNQLMKDGKEDPEAEKAAKQLGKSIWNQFDGRDPKQAEAQKEAVRGMSDDEFRTNVSAADFGKASSLGKWSQVADYAKNGKPEQKAAAAAWAGNTDAEQMRSFLTEKKAKVDEIPKEWFDNAGVARYALDKTSKDASARAALMDDDKKRQALQGAAMAGIDQAEAAGDERAMSSLAVEAIKTGALTAGDIKGDAKLQAAIGKNLDPRTLAKGVDKSDQQQVDAAQAAMASFFAANPGKEEKFRKNDQYEGLMPSAPALAAAPAAARTDTGSTAPAAASDAGSDEPLELEVSPKEVERVIDQALSSAGAQDEGLRRSVDQLRQALDRRERAVQSKSAGMDEGTLKRIDASIAEQNQVIEKLTRELRGGGKPA